MIPYTVLGGYLGAGKTTLLNHLLAAADRRVAVLVNDFGEINIDAALIDEASDARINLTNGCICCSLSDGFHDALEQLLALVPRPEHIVVEASGVADVHNLAQYGHSPELQLDGVIVLADLETVRVKAMDKYVGQTVRRQLAAADVIVANKSDLLAEDQRSAVINWLQDSFPQAVVQPTSFGELPLPLLLGVHLEAHMPTEPAGHAHFTRWTWQSEVPVGRAALESFLAGLDDSVIRLKGFIDDGQSRWVVQVVGARREIRAAPENGDTGSQLVAIGLRAGFEPAVLDQLAESCLPS